MLDDAIPVLQSKTKQDYSVEVILVDDGSKDATCAEYAKYVKSKLHLSPNITFKLLKLPQNCGKGRAVSEVQEMDAKSKANLINSFPFSVGILGSSW